MALEFQNKTLAHYSFALADKKMAVVLPDEEVHAYTLDGNATTRTGSLWTRVWQAQDTRTMKFYRLVANGDLFLLKKF